MCMCKREKKERRTWWEILTDNGNVWMSQWGSGRGGTPTVQGICLGLSSHGDCRWEAKSRWLDTQNRMASPPSGLSQQWHYSASNKFSLCSLLSSFLEPTVTMPQGLWLIANPYISLSLSLTHTHGEREREPMGTPTPSLHHYQSINSLSLSLSHTHNNMYTPPQHTI